MRCARLPVLNAVLTLTSTRAVHHLDPEWHGGVDDQSGRHGGRHARRDWPPPHPSGTYGTPARDRLETDVEAVLTRGAQYVIVNLGMSENFGFVDIEHLTFPTTMSIDWIRVYQEPNSINVGCDPKDFPTTAYINECVPADCLSRASCADRSRSACRRYIDAYTNPNLTTWVDDYKQTIPKNSFLGQ